MSFSPQQSSSFSFLDVFLSNFRRQLSCDSSSFIFSQALFFSDMPERIWGSSKQDTIFFDYRAKSFLRTTFAITRLYSRKKKKNEKIPFFMIRRFSGEISFIGFVDRGANSRILILEGFEELISGFMPSIIFMKRLLFSERLSLARSYLSLYWLQEATGLMRRTRPVWDFLVQTKRDICAGVNGTSLPKLSLNSGS